MAGIQTKLRSRVPAPKGPKSVGIGWTVLIEAVSSYKQTPTPIPVYRQIFGIVLLSVQPPPPPPGSRHSLFVPSLMSAHFPVKINLYSLISPLIIVTCLDYPN